MNRNVFEILTLIDMLHSFRKLNKILWRTARAKFQVVFPDYSKRQRQKRYRTRSFVRYFFKLATDSF